MGRALTGKEFETMAELNKKERDEFLEKVLLPTAFWGTTAGTARAVRGWLRGSKAGTGRKKLGEKSLGRALSKKQGEALERAHRVGMGEKGKDGTPAGIGNYTEAQLREKNKILKESGFTKEDIRKLMENGIVGWRFWKRAPPKSIKTETTEEIPSVSANKEATEEIEQMPSDFDKELRAAEEELRAFKEALRVAKERRNQTRKMRQIILSDLAKQSAERTISPIPATKINIEQLSDTTETEAKELIQKFKKETDDLPDIKFWDEDMSRFMASDEIEQPTSALRFIEGMNFAAGKLQYVIKRSNGARLYHGSKSSSLLIFAKNNPLGGLKGIQEGVSTVKITDFDVALAYAKELSSSKAFIEKRISLSEVSEGANKLIEEDFPVIYGIKPKQDKKINPHFPDIPILMGESQGAGVDVLLEGGVSLQEISSVFVPAHKVKSVENMIKTLNLNHEITVSPIELIEETGMR